MITLISTYNKYNVILELIIWSIILNFLCLLNQVSLIDIKNGMAFYVSEDFSTKIVIYSMFTWAIELYFDFDKILIILIKKVLQ